MDAVPTDMQCHVTINNTSLLCAHLLVCPPFGVPTCCE